MCMQMSISYEAHQDVWHGLRGPAFSVSVDEICVLDRQVAPCLPEVAQSMGSCCSQCERPSKGDGLPQSVSLSLSGITVFQLVWQP